MSRGQQPASEFRRGRFRRFLDAWDVLIVIMAAGLLTGAITFMATDTHPDQCRAAVSHLPGRPHFEWVCQHP